MIAFHTIQGLAEQISRWKKAGLTIGFVPTMGNLHAGHLSLIELAQRQADRVVASVFVNPLQFGVGEDFNSYPRTLIQDTAQLKSVGCDALFAPSVAEMYPQGVLSTQVLASKGLSELWEGATRPGHFDGVATVVAKLLNIVQPDVAIFGQKDYQQWCVLKQMVRDLNWPVELIKAPIMRAEDGLAFSSRNQYLTSDQRKVAPGLYVELQQLAQAIRAVGNQDFRKLEEKAAQTLLNNGFDQVDYIAVVDPISLQRLNQIQAQLTLLAVARLGKVRLLDNVELDVQ